jgi:peroxiredoxin
MAKPKQLNFYNSAPDLKLLDTSGKPVRLSSLWKKKPLLLAFTRHFGCTQCKEMLDELEEGKARIHAAGLGVAVILQGTPEESAAFAKQHAPGLKVLADPDRRGVTCSRPFSTQKSGQQSRNPGKKATR